MIFSFIRKATRICHVYLCCFSVWVFLYACSSANKPIDEPATDPVNYTVTEIKYNYGEQAALRYIDSLLAAEPRNAEFRYNSYKHKYNIYQNDLQRYDTALVYADSMLAILKQDPAVEDYNSRYALATNAKANAYFYAGNYKAAFEWYNLNGNEDVEGATPCFNASHHFRIAMTLYKTERYLQAAAHFKKSALLYEECPTKNVEFYYRQQENTDNIGLCYYKAGNYDSAMHYYHKALQQIDRYKQIFNNKQRLWDFAIAVVRDNMGSVYALTNRPDSAEYSFLQSLQLSEEQPRHRFHIHTKLAKLYIQQQQYNKAGAQLAVAEAMLEDGNKPEAGYAYEYEEAEWLYESRIGNIPMAYEHLQRYQQLKDSLFVKQKDALIEELYAAGEKEAVQRADITSKNERIRFQSRLTLIFVAISVLLAGGWLLRRLMKQSRKFSNYRLAKAEQERKLKGELLQKERHLLSIMNNTDDLVWAVDTYFKLTTFNKAYDELIHNITGRYAEVGKPSNIAAASPRMYEKWIGWHKRAMGGEAFTVVDTVTGLRAGDMDIEARFWPLHDSDNNIIGVGCLVRNISEYITNTRKIEAQTDALKEIAHMQSHDVRGPVATMKGLMQLIHVSDEENAELLRQLEKQLDELDKAIHAINSKTQQS